ncbi:MAG: DUF2341 domain-containing protein [Elusimicrobiota bacterium]
MAKRLAVCFFLCVVVVFLAAGDSHALWWVETNSTDWNDGYFYRSTSTVDDLRIREWTDWLGSTWTQRMVIVINNENNPNTLTDYQITLTTNTKILVDANRMDPQGNSIRFTESDGVTIIPHWTEFWNITTSTGSKFWVRVSTIPANLSSKEIYMYYGNVSTNNVSNRGAVLDLYEDWESGEIAYGTKWFGSDSEPFRIAIDTYTSSSDFDMVYRGTYSVCNANILDTQISGIYTNLNVSMPVKINFWWSRYGENQEDYPEFLIDGISRGQLKAQIIPPPWTAAQFNTTYSGLITIKWRYYKNPGTTVLPDRGWIDNIVVTKYADPEPTVFVPYSETKTNYYSSAKYHSDVLVTQGENSIVNYTSWSVSGIGTTKIYMRASDTSFLVTATLPSWAQVYDESKPSGIQGKYIQYQAEFTSDGSTAPSLGEISIEYRSPPPPPKNFMATTISTSVILWTWEDQANVVMSTSTYVYRIYMSTRALTAGGVGGYVSPGTSSLGLWKELTGDTTFWYEDNLIANKGYTRSVVAANDVGGNVGSPAMVMKYTRAVPPNVKSEYFRFLPISGSEYVPISTGVWHQHKYFGATTGNFVSQISSGPGTIQYYRVDWATVSFRAWNNNETRWEPVVSTVTHPDSGETITKKPEVLQQATLNRNSWYFHVASYNGDNELSTSSVLGPFYFNGCPSTITDLVALPSTSQEGCVILRWTAPYADSTFNNISSGKYYLKYRENFNISNDSQFDAAAGLVKLTTTVANQRETYVISGLIPGNTYWFAIKAEDSEGNKSELFVTTDTAIFFNRRTTAAKIAKIAFKTSPQTYSVGETAAQIFVETQDSANNPLAVAEDTNIYLYTDSSEGEFATTLSPTPNWTASGQGFVKVLKGTSTAAGFWYRDKKAGTPRITCDEGPDKQWTAGEQIQSVVPGSAVKFRIVYDTPNNYDSITKEPYPSNSTLWSEKTAFIQAIDGYGNISDRYRGGIISTTTPAEQAMIPSSHTFTAVDGGSKTVKIQNFYIAGPAWTKVQEVTDENYRDVYFYDENTGWAVGDKGTVKKTGNKGSSWYSQIYGASTLNGLNGVYFFDMFTGWAAGQAGRIIKTVDGGNTWSAQNSGSSAILYGVYFVNASTGFACGASGTLLKTYDGGSPWFSSNTGLPVNDLHSVYFIDENSGWVAGKNGSVYRTTDSGANWVSVSVPGLTTQNLYNIRFLTRKAAPGTGFIVGNSSEIYRTTDGGTSWTGVNSSTSQIIYDIDFNDPNTGIAAGSNGAIVRTTNGGTSWSVMSSTYTKSFYCADFYSAGFALGAEGTIVKSPDLGLTWAQWLMEGKSAVLNWKGTVFVPASDSFPPPATLRMGRDNQAMFLLGMRILNYQTGDNAKLTTVIFDKTGTINNAEASSVTVKLYRDTGDRQFSPTGDTFKGQTMFSPGTGQATFSGLSETLSGTTVYYFIVLNIPVLSDIINDTIGVRFPQNAFTIEAGGVPMARNNLAYSVPPATIVPSSCTVSFMDTDIAPTETTQGTKDLQVFRFDMSTDRSDSPWRRLTVERTGQNTADSDIDKVSVYAISVAPENFISSGVFSAGICNINFSNAPLIITTTQQFFVTMDISPNARYSTDTDTATVGLRLFSTTNYVRLDTDGMNGISPSGKEIASKLVKINVAYDMVLISPVFLTVPEIYQGEEKAFLALNISIDANNATWTRMRLGKTGTAGDSDITSASLYRDYDGNGSFNVNIDTYVAGSNFSGGISDIVFATPETIDRVLPQYATYFVTLKIAKTSGIDKTVAIRVATQTYVTVALPDRVSSANFPIQSSTATIKDYPDTVQATLTDMAPYDARVDETVLAGKIQLVTYVDATFQSLRLAHEGSASTDAVRTIRFYSDYNSDGGFSASDDMLIATASFNSSGIGMLNFATPPVIRDSTRTFFVVIELNPDKAEPGKNIGFGVDYTGFQYNLPNMGNNFGYFRCSLVKLLDRRTPTVPAVDLQFDNPTPVRISGRDVYFTNKSAEIKFNWRSEALNGIKELKYTIASYQIVTGTETPDVLSYWNTTADSSVSFSDINLKHNTVYHLWLKVYSTDDFVRTKNIEFKVDTTPPPAPNAPVHTARNGVSAAQSQNSYWVSWSAVSDAESDIMFYELQERLDTSPVWVSVSSTIAPSITDYQIKNKEEGKFYYYRVRARNYAGTWGSFSSDSKAAYLSLPSGPIEQLANYPNPFDSRYQKTTITYILKEDSEVTVRIFDLFGIPVTTMHFLKGQSPGGVQGANNILWDATNDQGQKIVQGMYIMSVEVKSDSSTIRKNWKIGVIH